MTTSFKIIAIVAAFSIGAGVGYTFVPTHVVEKVITKDVIKRDVVTKTVTVIDSSGHPVITTTEVDKSTSEASSATEKRIDRINKDWLVGAAVLADPLHFAKPTYEGTIQRRILGELYVGVLGSSAGTVGLGVSYRF